MFCPSPDPAAAEPMLRLDEPAPRRTLLVAQITDLHVGFDRAAPDDGNRRRLDALVAQIAALDRRPDLLFATGDLVEHGDEASYAQVRAALAPLGVPVHFALGNHDRRAAFRAAFPEVETDAHGYFQYVVETPALRCIVLDTLEEGRHGGGFCADRAAWLAARIAEAPLRPTLIVLHHPPFDSGIPWLTTDPDEPWVARLRAALAGAHTLVGLIAGHIHRPLVSRWAGAPCVVCPSAAPQVALALAPIAADRPDGRAMIVDGAPGLALHWWSGDALVSHFADAADLPVIVRHDGTMRDAVAHMMAERPS